MLEEYRTVARAGDHEIEVDRSRFLCALAPVPDERRAQEFVREARERHPSATHHCFAYVIGADAGVQRASDDGEPSGTAGPPMLQMLLRRDLRYVVAVVTRYFGGVKLGAGGLIRAYGSAVGRTLDILGTETLRRHRLVTIVVGHERAGRLENELRGAGRAVREVRHAEEVTIEIALPESDLPAFRAWLAAATAGRAELRPGGETYVGSADPGRGR